MKEARELLKKSYVLKTHDMNVRAFTIKSMRMGENSTTDQIETKTQLASNRKNVWEKKNHTFAAVAF